MGMGQRFNAGIAGPRFRVPKIVFLPHIVLPESSPRSAFGFRA